MSKDKNTSLKHAEYRRRADKINQSAPQIIQNNETQLESFHTFITFASEVMF